MTFLIKETRIDNGNSEAWSRFEMLDADSGDLLGRIDPLAQGHDESFRVIGYTVRFWGNDEACSGLQSTVRRSSGESISSLVERSRTEAWNLSADYYGPESLSDYDLELAQKEGAV